MVIGEGAGHIVWKKIEGERQMAETRRNEGEVLRESIAGGQRYELTRQRLTSGEDSVRDRGSRLRYCISVVYTRPLTSYMTRDDTTFPGHVAHPVRRGYHHTPSFSLTTRTNLTISLSSSFLSPSLVRPCKNGVISSGRHRALVRNRSANRVGACSGRA